MSEEHPIGRPTKYTPDRVKRITDALALGASYRRAAQAGGIHIDTLIEWRKEHSEFSEAVEKAEAKNTTRCLKSITKAADNGNWTAGAWLLERRYPREYGRREDLTSNGQTLTGLVIKLDGDE